MSVTATGWNRWHDRWAPWCALRDTPHSHTMQLNGPHLVNGRPAGPQLLASVRAVYRSGDVLAGLLPGATGAEGN